MVDKRATMSRLLFIACVLAVVVGPVVAIPTNGDCSILRSKFSLMFSGATCSQCQMRCLQDTSQFSCTGISFDQRATTASQLPYKDCGDGYFAGKWKKTKTSLCVQLNGINGLISANETTAAVCKANCAKDESCSRTVFNFKRHYYKSGPPKNCMPRTPISGLCLSGGGFMPVYQAGVIAGLAESKAINPRAVKMAGSSLGAFIAAASCAGVKPNTVYNALREMMDAMRNGRSPCKRRGCRGDMDNLIREKLEAIIPTGRAFRACNNKLFLQLSTPADPTKRWRSPAMCTKDGYRATTVATFTSREMLINAVAASSFVPGLSAANCSRQVTGNQFGAEGTFTSRMPCPARDISPNNLRVLSFPAQRWNSKLDFGSKTPDVYPGVRNGRSPIPLGRVGNYQSFQVLSSHSIDAKKLYDAGIADANEWMLRNC